MCLYLRSTECCNHNGYSYNRPLVTNMSTCPLFWLAPLYCCFTAKRIHCWLPSYPALDENWFLCMSAVFLSWCGVSSVVRRSSVTARWSHVVSRLWSLLTVCWVMVGWVAHLVPVADSAVDWLWLCWRLYCWVVKCMVCIMVFQVLWLYYGSHLVMVWWVASLMVFSDGATSTELSSLFFWTAFYLCVWHVAFLCCMSVRFCCVHWCPRVSSYMNGDVFCCRWLYSLVSCHENFGPGGVWRTKNGPYARAVFIRVL